MKLSLTDDELNAYYSELHAANADFKGHYPADSFERQPVHTVYGGANLFKAGFAGKLGEVALKMIDTYAPNYLVFARALGLPGAEILPTNPVYQRSLTQALEENPEQVRGVKPAAWLAYTVFNRVVKKLQSEPIEDNRIDFEDGYGNRPDQEEDTHAAAAAEEVAKGMRDKVLSPFIGIRIKTFSDECKVRSIRTLDIFLTRLAELTGSQLPANFIVTLPKVTTPTQVATCAKILENLEARLGFPKDSLKMEIMIETTQSIINHKGENTVPLLVAAANGRCRSAIFGTYDYTASCNITAAYQSHTHPASDFARHVLQVSLAGTGITISDGATTSMPIGPHKASADAPLTPQQMDENRTVVHSAWRLHYENIIHSLRHAYYQGWDLNPGQLPVRYAAVDTFFLSGLQDASARLNAFLNKAAQATLVGNTFDDAATGQGLLNFFLRGMACGAITEQEVLATGITLDELRSRSFVRIVNDRAKH
ncbi:MAG TPA: phosphoenolpyruvate kinase [Accumulibacter sp.]|nr:phosphoenolpyruvate kinase [Accumulibacter sp.]HMW17842.1 phosphoenolpyruvate kinase [Accumulibacter sp.]HMX22137.1 phosphoenolpyruvate kinase [Accumulibacter sp.]HNC17925.1 phosphoenolpyruvate kinase [Accumulibacter sp.]HND80789.1 phosphoenolpyruvate kinase [Accumulibacter sp.]